MKCTGYDPTCDGCASKHIGCIFRFHNLPPFLNSRDNVAVVPDLARRERAVADTRSRNCSIAWRSGAAQRLLATDLLRKVAGEQQAAILAVMHDEKVFDRCDRIFHRSATGAWMNEPGAERMGKRHTGRAEGTMRFARKTSLAYRG